jgi:FAD-linked oxidoreductase
VGAGHSWSPVAGPDYKALSLERCNRVLGANGDAVTVQAGIRLRDLNAELARRGLALPVLGTVAHQTVAGATATGTHGTGIRFGCLSTLIRSLELVTADGETLRVSGVENAELLPAARASLGLLGVVTQATLTCEPAFNLRVLERPTTLDDVLADLGRLLAANEHFKFWWWPHTQAVRAWEYNRTEVPAETGRLLRLAQDYLAFILPAWPGLFLGQAVPSAIPRLVRFHAEHFNRRRDRVERSDHGFTYPVPIRHFEMEYAVPVEAAQEAVEGVRDLIERERLLVDFVLEVRFAAADDVWLSPAYGRDTCYVGALVYRPDSVAPYYAAVESLMRSLSGRPHLGKMHAATPAQLEQAYPRLLDFRELRRRLDPERRFGNAYLDRLIG